MKNSVCKKTGCYITELPTGQLKTNVQSNTQRQRLQIPGANNIKRKDYRS